jgi:ankyrin repeat protein
MKIIQITFFACCFVLLAGCQSKPGKDNGNNQNKDQETVEQKSSSETQPQIPIHDAALSGNLEAVKAHIENGADLEATNQQGHTPIMLASFNGHTEIVQLLIENGANVNVTDQKKLTPLHFAASGAFPEAVELLLENGAEINATDDIEHFTPLMYAASEGNAEVVKILLKHGADISMVDDDGDDAKAFARQNNHSEILEILQNPANMK